MFNNDIVHFKGVSYIKKNFYLASNFDLTKGKPAIDDLNKLLSNVGIKFNVATVGSGKKLFITVDEKKLQSATYKGGRPVEHNINFSEIEQMRTDGMTNRQIYEKLGISKSLFYLKMREYKNDIRHKNEM